MKASRFWPLFSANEGVRVLSISNKDRSQVSNSNEPEGPVHSHPPSHNIGNTAEKEKEESTEEEMKLKLGAERKAVESLGSSGRTHGCSGQLGELWGILRHSAGSWGALAYFGQVLRSSSEPWGALGMSGDLGSETRNEVPHCGL